MLELQTLTGALLAGLVVAVGVSLLLWRQLRVLGRQQTENLRLAERAEYEHAALVSQIDVQDARIDALTTQLDEQRELNKQLGLADQELRAEHRALQVRYENVQQQLSERLEELSRAQSAMQALEQEHRQLVQKHAAMTSSQEERDRQHRQQLAQFDEQKALLAKEFENLAHRIFEEKGKSFSSQSQKNLEQLLTPFREQITEFRQRVDGIQKENHEAAGSLKKELEHLRQLNQEMTEDAKNLTRALKGDKKKVGVWGEIQLEKTLQLAGLVKGDHYASQAHFKDEEGRNNYPDFVVKLPDDKHMIIDSKVSLIDYDAAISAVDEDAVKAALAAHTQAVKNHIDNLAAKDYSNLIGMRSPSFVLMFMPIEPAYIEAMRHNPELFNYGYQRNVILVSHTTLMPILRTVANLWMIERSNAEAKLISDRAGDVYNQVCLLAERLGKLGGTLQTAGRQYNQTVVALAGQQGLHGKVERFSQLSSKITKSMPDLEPLHSDLDTERLEVMKVVAETEDARSQDEETMAEGEEGK